MIDIFCNTSDQYRLLDSGNGKKLEEFAGTRIVRSEPKAWWKPALPKSEWMKAAAVHDDETRDAGWHFRGGKAPEPWNFRHRDAFTLQLRFMDRSKQIGAFPEQSPHWDFILNNPVPAGTKKKLLNLFGYTGAATLAAARAGWHVTHVDASKPAVAWGRRNQEISGLANAPVRWILEDAVKFCRREVRRGNAYEAILLDPPAFGRGPAGELWKVERDLPELLELCRQLLSGDASLMILTLYTIDGSSLLCKNLIEETTRGLGGNTVCGELTTHDLAGNRPLPLSFWAKWHKF